MARYAAGDDAAFADVYDAVAPVLARFLGRRCADRALVEDLLQQTFLKIHCHRARFIAGAEVAPWACSIAVRLLIDRVRRDRRASVFLTPVADPDGPADTADPDAALLGRELARQVGVALGALPPEQRIAIEMMRDQGLSADEAARRLGTTPNAARIRLFKGLRAVRAFLGLGDRSPAAPPRTPDSRSPSRRPGASRPAGAPPSPVAADPPRPPREIVEAPPDEPPPEVP